MDLFNHSESQQAHFIAAVKLGETDFDKGDSLTHNEVAARIERLRGTDGNTRVEKGR